MAALIEFDNVLQSLLLSKPPGVSGSKIQSLTKIAVQNVQDNDRIVAQLFKHFKKTPGTHKLGVMYVVDSISRAYQDNARKNGQTSAEEGTFSGGLQQLASVLPSLMNDMIANSSEDQKEKAKKLIDIWDRAGTYSPALIADMRSKFSTIPPTSTTPPLPPPPTNLPINPLFNAPTASGLNGTAAPSGISNMGSTSLSSVMQAIAAMAKQNPSASSIQPEAPALVPQVPPSAAGPVGNFESPSKLAPFGSGDPRLDLNRGNINAQTQSPPITAPSISLLPAAVQAAPALAPSSTIPQVPNIADLAGILGSLDPQKLTIVQLLLQQGVPIAQIAAVLQQTGPTAVPTPPLQLASQPPQNRSYSPSPRRFTSRSPSPYSRRRRSQSRSRSPLRSPTNIRGRGRGRGRGPDRRDDRDLSPPRARRGSPSYDDFGPLRQDGFGKGRNWDRDRSPPRKRRSPSRSRSPPIKRRASPSYGRSSSPGRGIDPPIIDPSNYKPRNISSDPQLGSGLIKVLSRTLFVGGVLGSITEQKLAELFAPFGVVQTINITYEKRFAFIKMLSREAAVNAKEGAEVVPMGDTTLRTRWGVGYGARDYMDYSTGISIIPVDSLTDADRRWMLTAEYGGTGGRPITEGMVVEEPDIEIGQGVSSKAISQKKGGGMDKRGERSESGRGRGRGRGRDMGRGGKWDQAPPSDSSTPVSGSNSVPVFSGTSQQFPLSGLPPPPGSAQVTNGIPPPPFMMPDMAMWFQQFNQGAAPGQFQNNNQ